MIYLNLIFLAILAVYLCDLCGFIDTLKNAIGKRLGIALKRLPPLDCSLCMSWWFMLVYLLCIGECTIANLAIIAVVSFMALPIGQLLILIREATLAIIRIIQSKVDKI